MDYPAPEKKPGEDLVLDVNLDEPETPPPPPAGDVLDLTLDDEPAGSSAYPEVTETQQRAASNDVLLECLCSATRRAFEVRFEEAEPGVYYATDVTAGAKGPAAPGATKAGGLEQIAGTFRMGPEFACPCCGSPVMSACEKCGTTLCGGGTTKGGGCQCPGCGTELTLTSEAATSARGVGPGGKKKRLW